MDLYKIHKHSWPLKFQRCLRWKRINEKSKRASFSIPWDPHMGENNGRSLVVFFPPLLSPSLSLHSVSSRAVLLWKTMKQFLPLEANKQKNYRISWSLVEYGDFPLKTIDEIICLALQLVCNMILSPQKTTASVQINSIPGSILGKKYTCDRLVHVCYSPPCTWSMQDLNQLQSAMYFRLQLYGTHWNFWKPVPKSLFKKDPFPQSSWSCARRSLFSGTAFFCTTQKAEGGLQEKHCECPYAQII